LVSALLAGCGVVGPVACTTEAVAAVQVTVEDSLTSAPVTEGLEGRLTEASYEETMLVFDNLLIGAFERAGTYVVTVNATGYEEWTRSGIRVRRGECHVVPADLEARLTPVG
jgi:hypothetical protein